MITYVFTSNNFRGQIVNIQYSKYDSTTRINLGSGTFPFEYTTDQKGGTYYFYIPSIDRTFPKNIDIPPVDIYTEEINVPDCDISGVTIYVPPCDVTGTTIYVPVCDIDYDVTNITPTPTPSITPTQTGLPGITPTPTTTITITPTKTKTPIPTNTPTLTISPTTSPTQTPTNTPTPTTTPIPPFTILRTITDEDGYGVFGVESENAGNKLYVFTSADTKVYSTTDYTLGDTISSFYTTGDIINSIYETTTQKIYVGQSSNSILSSIDVSTRGIYPITLNGDVFGLTVDSTYNLIAVSSTYNPDGVSVIDSTTDFVNFEIDVVSNYKGGITSDNNGFCYVVGDSNIMTKIDILNGVSADTFNISNNSVFKRIIYNPINEYLYVLLQSGAVDIFDVDGRRITNIDITSYNYNASAYQNLVYDPNKDLIYIPNIESGTNELGIITIDCQTNTVLNYYSNIYVGNNGVFMKYSNVNQTIYVGFVFDPRILVLST